MTPHEFESYLDLYGADLSRWPAELRSVASTQYGQQLAAMARVEEVLRQQVPASRVLTDRVLALSQLPQQSGFDFSFLGSWFRPVAALAVAASLVLGLVVGGIADTSGYQTAASVDEVIPGLTWSPGDFGGEGA